MARFRKFQHGSHHFHTGRPFQHWYRDNSVYFITATCREHFPAFKLEQAKSIFWDRFSHYVVEAGFVPWVTTLLTTHYHTLGYLKKGENLGKMMQRIHGSTAKRVNDLLPERRVPFWRGKGRSDYFDGCIRDEIKCRRAYRYVMTQSVRHRICSDWRHYPNTRVEIDLERGLKRALELRSFMEGVWYPRYDEK